MSPATTSSSVPALDAALGHVRRAAEHLASARAAAGPIPDATAWHSPAGRVFHARADDWAGRLAGPALRGEEAVDALLRARLLALMREAAGG